VGFGGFTQGELGLLGFLFTIGGKHVIG